VLTRARFLCDGAQALQLKLADERTLLGKVRWKDEALDAAIIEAEGGEGVALPPGDAAAATLSGLLLKGKLENDALSELARFHFAVEFPGTVPPEGSPVVDDSGHVIAMVGRALDEHRVLALPLPVVAQAGASLTVPAARWAEVEARAQPAAEAEVETAREALSRVMLATAVVDAQGGLFVMVLHRTGAGVRFSLSVGGCRAQVSEAPWVPFDARDAVDVASRRLFAYLARAKLDSGLSMAVLQLGGCEKVESEAPVRVGDTLFEQGRVGHVARRLEATMAAAPAAPGMDEVAAVPAPARGDDLSIERQWRQRYRDAQKHIADVEKSLVEDREYIRWADHRGNDRRFPMWQLTPDERQRYDAAKERLTHADELRAQAKEQLDQLDHDAANAAVPLEWRR
jgi:hypothetical protein